MDIFEAIKERHSVRSYKREPIDEKTADELRNYIDEVNAESGLNIQLQLNEPDGFSGMLAKYGSFDGVENYIVLAGAQNRDFDIGYYGEKIVLKAQMSGLNTCWVALTFNKKKAKFTLRDGEKLYVVISLGYGVTQGKARHSKKPQDVSNITENSPQWFKKGIDAALLAPTAINQQKFYFELNDDGNVTASAPKGIYTQMDLGIVKYHFDIAIKH